MKQLVDIIENFYDNVGATKIANIEKANQIYKKFLKSMIDDESGFRSWPSDKTYKKLDKIPENAIIVWGNGNHNFYAKKVSNDAWECYEDSQNGQYVVKMMGYYGSQQISYCMYKWISELKRTKDYSHFPVIAEIDKEIESSTYRKLNY